MSNRSSDDGKRKRKRASKRSPKPAAKPEGFTKLGKPRTNRPGQGRPEGQGFHPTDEQRAMVKAAAGYRIPEDEIVQVIINPATKRPISKVTLIKHFKDEIAQGYATLRIRIMAATVRNALGEVEPVQRADGTTGTRVVKEGNVTAQIWLQKTLYGAREQVDVVPPSALKSEEDQSTLDAARRVAFTMALGARIVKEQKQPKGKR